MLILLILAILELRSAILKFKQGICKMDVVYFMNRHKMLLLFVVVFIGFMSTEKKKVFFSF